MSKKHKKALDGGNDRTMGSPHGSPRRFRRNAAKREQWRNERINPEAWLHRSK